MPNIAGVDVRRPSSYTRTVDPVRSDTTLASGTLVRYQAGVRSRFSLSWRRATSTTVAAVEAIGRRGGSFPYLDELTGQTYIVLVDGAPSADAVAGTDPVRYDIDLDLIEANVRRG